MAFMDMKDKVPPHNLEAEQAVIGKVLEVKAAKHSRKR